MPAESGKHGKLCFVRHGQALHNVCNANLQTADNPLTDEGLVQCKHARDSWAGQTFAAADLVVVSPLRRALQTAARLNGDTVDGRFLVTPLCTERWSAKCDE